MHELKKIILCADDFGLNPGVSKGILKLVGMGRLSAVSCMVNMPDFTKSVGQLLAHKNHIQIGMHFNLTEGEFLSIPGKKCFSLYQLLFKAYFGLLNSSLIVEEFNAQLDQFIQFMGCLPNFIDGHQHIHQLPTVRESILNLYHKRIKGAYLRLTYPTLALPKHQLKSRALACLGGKKLYVQVRDQNIPHNDFFSGVYDFNPEVNYRTLFRQWLASAVTNTLIMCHPGELCSSDDVIGKARSNELEYFLSEGFQNDCREFSIHLTTSPVAR